MGPILSFIMFILLWHHSHVKNAATENFFRMVPNDGVRPGIGTSPDIGKTVQSGYDKYIDQTPGLEAFYVGGGDSGDDNEEEDDDQIAIIGDVNTFNELIQQPSTDYSPIDRLIVSQEPSRTNDAIRDNKFSRYFGFAPPADTQSTFEEVDPITRHSFGSLTSMQHQSIQQNRSNGFHSWLLEDDEYPSSAEESESQTGNELEEDEEDYKERLQLLGSDYEEDEPVEEIRKSLRKSSSVTEEIKKNSRNAVSLSEQQQEDIRSALNNLRTSLAPRNETSSNTTSSNIEKEEHKPKPRLKSLKELQRGSIDRAIMKLKRETRMVTDVSAIEESGSSQNNVKDIAVIKPTESESGGSVAITLNQEEDKLGIEVRNQKNVKDESDDAVTTKLNEDGGKVDIELETQENEKEEPDDAVVTKLNEEEDKVDIELAGTENEENAKEESDENNDDSKTKIIKLDETIAPNLVNTEEANWKDSMLNEKAENDTKLEKQRSSRISKQRSIILLKGQKIAIPASGCYLISDPANDGALLLRWSSVRLHNAFAFFSVGAEVSLPEYKIKNNTVETSVSVRNSVHQAIVSFLRTAQKYAGIVVFYSRCEEFECSVYAIEKNKIVTLISHDLPVDLAHDDVLALAVVDTASDGYKGLYHTSKAKFLNIGHREGAVLDLNNDVLLRRSIKRTAKRKKVPTPKEAVAEKTT
uniref:Uncharacterized protein n=1 Tax=Aplanochytrium stocchinoi TaxID=215587 RepID=A0A7S3PI05_9STRA